MNIGVSELLVISGICILLTLIAAAAAGFAVYMIKQKKS